MSKFVRIAGAAAVLILMLPGAASAQQTAPSPAALMMAREIIEMKGAMTTFDPLIRGVIEYHRNIMIQTNPNLAGEIEKVAAQMINDLQGRKVEMQQELAKTYAQHFTEQELRDALFFYHTPLGRKLLAQEPKAMEETMKAADTWSKKFADEVVAKMREEMRKRGHNVI